MIMENYYLSEYKIGILGAGQLGMMLLQAAVDYNLSIELLDPDPNAPCKTITNKIVTGSLTDFDTVYQFGKNKNLITIEIENVNVEALKQLENEGVRVFPQPHIIELIQDKRVQKQFYSQHNIPTAEYVLIDSIENLSQYESWLPAVQKLGKEGYDGRGVQMLYSTNDFVKAFTKPSLLEKKIDFDKELSVIVARNASGDVSTFPTVEMAFHPEHNLVEFLFAPAQVSEEIHVKAKEVAIKVIEALGLVGILAVEMFLTKSGDIIVNEVAPRPHNSGHQTIRANATSQYEQHWRAILNMPLASTQQLSPAAMVNILGADGYSGPTHYEGLKETMQLSGVFPFLYGKKTTKPFRKMGHITIIDDSIEKVKEKAYVVKSLLKVVSK
jgi:5-(carboxyamino)imidazole ribonucleotide synthase